MSTTPAMTPEDLAYHNQWQPASGHPKGWRVARGLSPVEELESKNGRRILFKCLASAQRRAAEMNNNEHHTPSPRS